MPRPSNLPNPLKLVENLPAYENPPAEVRVRGLMYTDHKGQVQVVAPESALVDPEPIRETTARDLQAVPESTDSTICAVPGSYGLPTVVHANLKEQAYVALATEIPGEYVRVSGAQFAEMCDGHASYDTQFCEDLVATPADRSADEEDILAAIDTFTTRRIEARLDETMHIPPLPEAAQRIMALQQEVDFDLSDLVQIIETDPAIAARIMGWANSAFYGGNTPARSIDDAIMRVLGFDMVFNMALGMALGATLSLPKHQVSGASPYWLDAVYGAATMEALAKQIPSHQRPNVGTCYLAGLLHGFGTLVIGHVFVPQYRTICHLQETNPHLSHTYVDQHVLSVNREVIAAALLDQWEVPAEVTTAVRFQQVPGYEGEHQVYVRLLHLTLALMASDEIYESEIEAAAELGISAHQLKDVCEVLEASRSDLGEIAKEITPPAN